MNEKVKTKTHYLDVPASTCIPFPPRLFAVTLTSRIELSHQ